MVVLKLGLRSWRSAPVALILQAVLSGVFGFASGLFFWFQTELGPMIERLKTEQVITAFIASGVPQDHEVELVDSIQTSLSAANFKGFTIEKVGAEQFIKKLDQSHPRLAQEIRNLGDEAVDLVPRTISVSGVFSKSPLPLIQGIPGIDSTETSLNRYQAIAESFEFLKAVMLGLGILALLGWAMLTTQASRLFRVHFQEIRSWIELMGAGRIQTLTPPFVHTLSFALLTGMTAALLLKISSAAVVSRIQWLSPTLASITTPSSSWFLMTFGCGLLLGGLAFLPYAFMPKKN